MTQPPRHLFKYATLVGILLAAGCQPSSSGSGSSSADATAAQKEANLPYQIIRRGMIPYSHLVTVTGRLEIVDISDNNKVVLKKTKVLPNTLVTLNPGEIQFNVTTVSTTPLVRRHIYELRLYPQ